MLYQTLPPSKFIPLSYILGDGAKAPTRFVRSVIKNAVTGAIISVGGNDFVNLTDNGDGDFSLFEHTPASLSIAEETYIRVLTTVYKDSGYTNADTRRYQVLEEVYLVRTELGGAVLTGRQIGNISEAVGARLNEIVKEFFDFNQWAKLKNKNSFARKFLGIKSEFTNIEKSIENSSEKQKQQSVDIINEVKGAEMDLLQGQKTLKENVIASTIILQEIKEFDLLGKMKEQLDVLNILKETLKNIKEDKKSDKEDIKKGIDDFKEELKRIKTDISEEKITEAINLIEEWVKKIETAIPLLTQAEILERNILMRELQKMIK